MHKPKKKRAPHGATSSMVFAALWQLQARSSEYEGVYRLDLLKALSLPETTVDDRLRTLIKQGLVVRIGWGLYAPASIPGVRMDMGQAEKEQDTPKPQAVHIERRAQRRKPTSLAALFGKRNGFSRQRCDGAVWVSAALLTARSAAPALAI